ncbi:MAG TPA: H(+)/Cl(-) exchange transporter ClcA [Planctomycetaceae bacterium]|jgi:CIC family chloride channel protein|nr:H(+)/Cl(-) exchange transporter ClcA [Planctomycetaceae bacterium]
MRTQPQEAGGLEKGLGSLPALAILSVVAGALAGFVGAMFRLALQKADDLREVAIARAHSLNLLGLVIVMGAVAISVAFAAWLVRRLSPYASGSGIPHVEAVLREELPQAPFSLVPIKFVGGLLAIGCGLALGREGPSVQMGSTIAHYLGRAFRRDLPDCLVLLAAGAGAGLATAFNAPIAGAVFVLEELVRRFDTRITIATFGASAGAIAVSRVFLGQEPDFAVQLQPYLGLATVPLHLALGVVVGLLGVAYNQAILGALSATERLNRWPVELRAALIGALVGLIAWFWPGLVGGGDPITQKTLAGGQLLGWVLPVLALRFVLGPISYAARTPGGLFAPLLVLGTQSGLAFGMLCQHWAPDAAIDPKALAVVGMAAFFTAVVRAPLTGIILVTEMTGNFTLLLPMLAACFAAMLVPTLLGNAPIYDSLRESTLRIVPTKLSTDVESESKSVALPPE